MTAQEMRLQGLRRQIARLERQENALARLGNRYAWIRLAAFLGGTALAGMLWIAGGRWAGLLGALIGLAAFGTAAHFHRRVKDSIARREIWRAIKLAHVARIELDWAGLPPSSPAPARPATALETDLDLVGERSLHRLIDTSLSHGGSQRLRDWLGTGVPAVDRLQERQALVRELACLPVFRGRLRMSAALAAKDRSWQWEGQRVLDWTARLGPATALRGTIGVLTALAILDAALFLLGQLAELRAYWGIPFVAYVGMYLWKVQQLGDPFDQALALSDPFYDLQAVFGVLETYRYGKNEHLKTLCAPFRAGEHRPSVQLRGITRVLAAASLRRNPLLWTLISAILPWDVYIAYLLDRRRAAVAEVLPRWLDVWFELEALNSLADFAYLNPDSPFPELAADGPVVVATGLGHPLIAAGERVCNDFALDRLGELVMITGSNMSGKSTFLRSLGVNLCLAYAGGTVCAQALRIVPLRLFTCIRLTDSVTDGISYFYAEVKRLKALLDALEGDHPFPLFFLIDEIFRGTNNRERLIGSRSYIRALVGRHGAGVIATHDLELVKLADALDQIANYHFTETILDGRMRFDYRLRPGPSPTTNALKIMRLEGLPVEVPDASDDG